MKKLLALLLLLLVAPSAMAATFHYDNERSGEGITVSETEAGGIAWVLFTHTDGLEYGNSVPPIVSPSPPPPDFEPGDGICEDPVPIWFTGHAVVFVDDVGIGPFYYTSAPDYPFTEDGQVGDNFEVGTFHIEKLADGYSLILESNGMISDMYIFNTVHEFHEELAQ